MRWIAIAMFCILISILAWSCGSSEGDSGRERKPAADNNLANDGTDDEESDNVDSDSTKHTVLIIDDGFDTSHPVFNNRVKGKYTISCQPKEGSESQPTNLETMKQSLISQYGKQDSSCSVAKNITFVIPEEFTAIEGQRAVWNQAVMAKSSDITNSQYDNLYSIITGRTTKSNFHGTNTSGLIAYQNDNVQLILVQMKLGSAGDAIIDDETECPDQDEIDLWVEAHADSVVREAHKKAPISALLTKLLAIIDEENVTLVNLSLGTFSSDGLAEKLAEEGCGNLNFKDQYQTEGELNRAQELYRIENALYQTTNYLTVQAAGNEGRRIDNASDAAECSDPALGLIVAGSFDFSGGVSKFSNYGDCVDFFTLGANVVTTAPDGFLNVVNGTSFSAPLLVRFISTKFAVDTSFTEIISGLEKIAASDKTLPKSTFPEELAFESDNDVVEYALSQNSRQDYPSVSMPLLRKKLQGIKYGYSQPGMKLRSFSIAR